MGVVTLLLVGVYGKVSQHCLRWRTGLEHVASFSDSLLTYHLKIPPAKNQALHYNTTTAT